MATAPRNKWVYRHNPEARARRLESNARSRQRNASPERERMNRLASQICHLRDSIGRLMERLETKDKRLLELVAERERLKRAKGSDDERRSL